MLPGGLGLAGLRDVLLLTVVAEAVRGHVEDLGTGVGVLDLDDVDVGRAEAGDLVGGAGRLDGGAVDRRGRGPRAVDLQRPEVAGAHGGGLDEDRLRRVRSEEHTSELQSLMRISYAVFCLNKKKIHY